MKWFFKLGDCRTIVQAMEGSKRRERGGRRKRSIESQVEKQSSRVKGSRKGPPSEEKTGFNGHGDKNNTWFNDHRDKNTTWFNDHKDKNNTWLNGHGKKGEGQVHYRIESAWGGQQKNRRTEEQRRILDYQDKSKKRRSMLALGWREKKKM